MKCGPGSWGIIGPYRILISEKKANITVGNILPKPVPPIHVLWSGMSVRYPHPSSRNNTMRISGIQPFTLLDYPGKIACIVFTPGCNFRCGYCHNPEFVLPEEIKKIRESFIPEDRFFAFLERRRGLLDGVVVSGGEPTLMPDLHAFIEKIKNYGFLVKLDTNGNRPMVIESLIKDRLLDYIAMDIKTAFSAYANLVGPLVFTKALGKSMDIIKRSGVEYEFRSTLIREVHTEALFEQMVPMLAGAKRLYLQRFRPGHTLNPVFQQYHPFSDKEMEEIADRFRPHVASVSIR